MGYTNPYKNSYTPYSNPYEANRSVAPNGSNWMGGTNVDASGPYQPSHDWSQPTFKYDNYGMNNRNTHVPGYHAPKSSHIDACDAAMKAALGAGAFAGAKAGKYQGQISCPPGRTRSACVAGYTAAGAAAGAYEARSLAANSGACMQAREKPYATCDGSDHYCEGHNLK